MNWEGHTTKLSGERRGADLLLDATNEVAWFQLAQAQRALGNAAEQQKAVAEFQRLRDLKRQAEINVLTRQEVTKQSLDSKPYQE